MSDAAIKAALEVAARMACYGGMSGDRCDQCADPSQCRSMPDWQPGTAAAIAAFLEHMEVIQHMKTDEGWIDIAAAVRRAAGGE